MLTEISNSVGVVVQRATSEALVGGIEEWEESSLLHDGSDFMPLFIRKIDTGWVMRAGVKDEYGSSRCCVKSLFHAFKVNTTGICFPVWITRCISESTALENHIVDSPSWVGVVNGDIAFEAADELARKAQGASSRQCLH